MIALNNAVRGAPEAAFWPTIASMILYSNSSTSLNLIILIVMMAAGSMTYVTMRQVKTIFNKAEDTPNVKRRNRRNKSHSKSKIEFIAEIFETCLNLLPSSMKIRVFIAILIFTDIAGLFGFLYLLGNQVLLAPDPSVTLTVFTLLPVVYVCVISCIMIWNL